MDEKINNFLESLENELSGLPKQEIEEALEYYREYLQEALDAGEDMDAVIDGLGSPEDISRIIRAEANIDKAQQNPGLKSFFRMLGSVFVGAKAPLTVASLSLFLLFTYSLVPLLYAGAFVSLIGAVVVLMGMLYQAFSLSPNFIWEIAGTIGAALFGSGVCAFIAAGFYWMGRFLVRFSARQLGRILGRRRKAPPQKREKIEKTGSKRPAVVLTAVTLSGLLLFTVSGMLWRYLVIFNSMKADKINKVIMEYTPGEISNIRLKTAHSCIKVTKNDTGKIIVSYEQPDWLDYTISGDGGTLAFYEESNGRLPLFQLTTLHESRTELHISLPEGYIPGEFSVESTGGFVFIQHMAGNTRVKTYTGSIFADLAGYTDNAQISAVTQHGSLFLEDEEGNRVRKRNPAQYESGSGNVKLRLESTRGSIHIN